MPTFNKEIIVSQFKTFLPILALVAGLSCSVPAPVEAAELTPAEFDKLHGQLTSAKEAWQSIPWHLSVLEACTQAAKENKPVYMLCRSGHPLGCV
jgi:hypothetical protein